jgi:hypothetical protein
MNENNETSFICLFTNAKDETLQPLNVKDIKASQTSLSKGYLILCENVCFFFGFFPKFMAYSGSYMYV